MLTLRGWWGPTVPVPHEVASHYKPARVADTEPTLYCVMQSQDKRRSQRIL